MIKYHQNGIDASEYGADHMLTNNWNPDKDYGNEYTNIYFRIEAKGYGYPSFSFEPEEKKTFYIEVREALEPLGWKWKEEGTDWNCGYIVNGKSQLYLHPQNFSGEIEKNMVKSIAEALNNGNTFQLRWIDLYDTVYDISNEEYEEYLNTRKVEIKSKIFEVAHTTRTTKFYSCFDIARVIAGKVRLRRLGLNDGRNYGSGQTIEYILNVIKEMIAEGYLVGMVKGDYEYCRSINKTEQKQLKLAAI